MSKLHFPLQVFKHWNIIEANTTSTTIAQQSLRHFTKLTQKSQTHFARAMKPLLNASPYVALEAMAELCCSKRRSGKDHTSGGFKEAYCTRWKDYSSFTTLKGHTQPALFSRANYTMMTGKKPTKFPAPSHLSICWRENLHLFEIS